MAPPLFWTRDEYIIVVASNKFLSPLRQKSNVLVASRIFREACCKFKPRREIEHTAIDLIEIDKHSFIFPLG